MEVTDRAFARQLQEQHARGDDHLGWFEALYQAARDRFGAGHRVADTAGGVHQVVGDWGDGRFAHLSYAV